MAAAEQWTPEEDQQDSSQHGDDIKPIDLNRLIPKQRDGTEVPALSPSDAPSVPEKTEETVEAEDDLGEAPDGVLPEHRREQEIPWIGKAVLGTPLWRQEPVPRTSRDPTKQGVRSNIGNKKSDRIREW